MPPGWAPERLAPATRALLLGALGLCGRSACAADAAQAPDQLTPFVASYEWLWHGAAVAVSTLKLERGPPGSWIYSSQSEPRGIGHLYPMRPQLRSVILVSGEEVRPLSFQATDGTSRNARGAELSFDWNAMHASGRYQGVTVDLPLKPGVQDDLSIQLAVLLALRQGRAPEHLSQVDKNSIRDYNYWREGSETLQTPLGSIATEIYASQHPGSPRITRFWFAPSEGYLPLRVQQKRLDSVEWTMQIETLELQ